MEKNFTLPRILHYNLCFKIEPMYNFFSVNGLVTINNDTNVGFSKINLLIYHSLKVKSIRYVDNIELDFTQEVISLKDEENYYINYITINLDGILEPNGQVILNIEYEGNINGYSHLMAYIKDKIDSDFSILRPDSHTYPIVAEPNFDSILQSYDNTFTYNISINIPKEYTAGCGGVLKKIEQIKENHIFCYVCNKPTWRFDIGIAKYSIVEDKNINVKLFVFPEHVTNAENIIIKEIRRAFDFFTNIFGDYNKDKYFTIVEVKESYGSQAGDNYVMMEEHGFSSDVKKLTHFYHEIGHTWNVKSRGDIKKSRFFDEAFACYFEALAIREFYGNNAFTDKMESYRKFYIESVQSDNINFYTPICDYGKYNIGYNSYTKGPWVLYILNKILGDNTFNNVIRYFLDKYKYKEVDFNDFEDTVHKVSGVDLCDFFKEWIYGIDSSEFLCKDVDLNYIADER